MNNQYQHHPLRKPQGWKGQEASLVMQIERLFDDVYIQIGQIKETLKKLDDRISKLEEE